MDINPKSRTTDAQSRIQALDALRGFALLGIYLAIIGSFNSSLMHRWEIRETATRADSILGLLSTTFISLRFIGLFSLLFGLGIAIQEKNRQASGLSFTPYYLRRSFILLLFGLFNTTFLFHAEILIVYAIFGLVAYAIARLNATLALVIAGFSFLVYGTYFELAHREDLLQSFAWFKDAYPLERTISIYTEGPLLEIIKLRWIEYGMLYADNGFHMGLSFALITLGYLIGSRDLHTRFLDNLPEYKKPFIHSLIYTLIFAAFAIINFRAFFIPTQGLVSFLCFELFLGTSLFTYIYAICALTKNSEGKNPILNALARNGRLSLTGYIGGALMYSIIFYTPGFGQYLQHGAVVQLFIALACYLAFTLFATLWLRRYPQGPLEALYRGLSGK